METQETRATVAGAAAPIGVFDSGVGGLTLVAALRHRLPEESILYLGDTARLPYGTKSPQTVARYARKNVDFLVRRGVKLVLVACNTASALGLSELDAPVPVVGVIEPGAAVAAELCRRRLGVIATESTIQSQAYVRALMSLRPDLEVIGRACPLFVPLAEEGWAEDPITRQIAARYLGPMLEQGIDSLLLGCTHYPLLASAIRQVTGDGVQVIDPAAAAAAAVDHLLSERGLRRSGPRESFGLKLFATDASERFGRVAETFLSEAVELEWVEV